MKPGYQVSIVNRARIKGFAKSELLRTKSDCVDAALIARFCAAIKPALWTPMAVDLAFGILKSQKPFDSNYLTATP